MLARNKPLLAVLAAVVLCVAAYAAAKTPVNPDEPITMTKGMYADLLCVAASEFDPYKGGVEFTYDPAGDTVNATYLQPTRFDKSLADPTKAASNRRDQVKERSNVRLKLVLPKLQQHVSAAASSSLTGF